LLPGIKAKNNPIVKREQLRRLLAEEKLDLVETERMLLLNVLDVHNTIVREIMVPRIDMVSVGVQEGPASAIEKAKKFGHSRLPLIGEDQDSVLGIIFIRDFLESTPRVKGGQTAKKERPLTRMCHPALFVPETKRVFDLLKEFQKERVHIAIVVDEYGGVSGLVTLEDILELFVGDILDEYDTEAKPIIHSERNIWSIDARMGVHDVNAETGAALPEDQADTIGGLFLELFGTVPKRRESVVWNGHKLVALSIRDNRILRVQLTLLAKAHELQKK
jgi:CBS domain containing-hemolysin-like protein